MDSHLANNPACGDESVNRRRLALAAAVFALVAIFGSFAPFRFSPLSPTEAIAKFREIVQRPVSAELRMDFAANVMLFMPLAFTLLGAASYGRSRGQSALLALFVVGACASFSVAIEFFQLWFPARQASLNDIAAESLGGAIGSTAWLVVGAPLMAWLATMGGDHDSYPNVRKALLAYCAAFVVFSMLPGDANLSATEVYHKFKAGRIILVPLSCDYGTPVNLVYSLIRDVVCMIPVGACAAVCLLPKGCKVHPLMHAVMQGMAYVTAIEIGQLFVISRYTDVTDLITGFIGVTIGAQLMRRRLVDGTHSEPVMRPPYQALGWALGGAGIAGLLFVVYWRPYDFAFNPAAKVRLDQFTAGLVSLPVWRAALARPSQAASKMISFAILGACLGMSIRRLDVSPAVYQLLRVAAVCLSFGLGLAIEVGQILLASHTAHIADAVLYGVGAMAGVGLATCRRSDRRAAVALELAP